MSDSELEPRLAATLHELAATGRMRPPTVEALLRRHRRNTHRRQAAAVASVSAAAVVTGLAVADATGSDRRSSDRLGVAPAGPAGRAACAADTDGSAAPSPSPSLASQAPVTSVPARSPSPSPSSTTGAGPQQTSAASAEQLAAARAAEQQRLAALAVSDPGLSAVCLPSPAPGFPLRRAHDSTDVTSFGHGPDALTRTFLVGTSPPVVTHDGSGSTRATPTGAEATVMVARAGAFPTSADDVRAAGEYPVIGATTARGQTATVVQSDRNQIGVLVTVHGFAIAAYGDNSAHPDDPVTVSQLVALIDSLEGVGD